jgi:dsDNA-specific endonuclease/ATPase MutS2
VATETASQATQGVVQAVVAQAQSMGASGLVAMGSAGAFQANHIFDNSHEAFDIARPMVVEFVDTGTITPPETSRFAGETIPVTTSFIGVKVGEARKQAQEAKTVEQEVKQAVEQAKEVAQQSEETKKQVVQEQQEKAQAEAREKAVEELGEEKVQEIEEKLNEPIPEPEQPSLPEQNAVREAFRSLFNRDEIEEDSSEI